MANERKPQAGWIVSPAFDLFFLANLGWLPLLIPGAATRDGSVVDFWQVYFLTLPHRWMTLVLVACDADRREGRSLRLAAIASFFAILVAGLYLGTGAFTCLAVADFVWNAWHFASQHAGVLRIYTRSVGGGILFLDRWGLRVFIGYAILRSPGWMEDWSFFHKVAPSLDAAMLAIPIVQMLIAFAGFRKERAGRTAYLASVCTLYSGLLLAAHYRDGKWVLAFATASALFHASEYLAIVGHYAWRRREVGSNGLFRRMARLWLPFLALYIVLLGCMGAMFDRKESVLYEWWQGLNLAAAFTHYAFDGMIWKLRRPETAKALGIGGRDANELVFAYLLCALPFAVPAGTALRSILPFTVTVALAGLALAAFAGLGSVINDVFDVADAGLAARNIVRSLLACILLVLLCTVLPLSLPAGRLWHAAALLLAVLPPLLLAGRERDLRLKRLEQFAETGRLVAAQKELETAVAIGGPFDSGKRTSAEWRAFLSEGIADIEKRVKRDDRPSVARAFQLIQLDRTAEAEALLKELSDPQASSLLGALHRGAERWADAEAAYRKAIADGTATWNAYEGLAEALRNRDKAEEALAVYAEAAEKMPEAKALATLKRGLLLADEGRSSAAIAALEEARKLDPKLEPEIAPRLRSIRASSFQCLPWR